MRLQSESRNYSAVFDDPDIKDRVLQYIRFEFIVEQYLVKRWQVVQKFGLSECEANFVLRKLQDSGRIVWDEFGIRPAHNSNASMRAAK